MRSHRASAIARVVVVTSSKFMLHFMRARAVLDASWREAVILGSPLDNEGRWRAERRKSGSFAMCPG